MARRQYCVVSSLFVFQQLQPVSFTVGFRYHRRKQGSREFHLWHIHARALGPLSGNNRGALFITYDWFHTACILQSLLRIPAVPYCIGCTDFSVRAVCVGPRLQLYPPHVCDKTFWWWSMRKGKKKNFESEIYLIWSIGPAHVLLFLTRFCQH